MSTNPTNLLCALLGVALTVGCGGDDEGTSSGGGGGNTSRVDAIAALDGNVTGGQTVYSQTCGLTSCHGPNGNDGAANAGDLPTLVPTKTKEEIIDIVINGTGDMVPQSQLSDQQVADAVAYVQDQWQ